MKHKCKKITLVDLITRLRIEDDNKDSELKGKIMSEMGAKANLVEVKHNGSQKRLKTKLGHKNKLSQPQFKKPKDLKGGKGDKSGKVWGKSSTPKVPAIPELNIEKELPKDAECLMDCEADAVLQGSQEQLLIMDPTIKLPVAFIKGLEHAKARNQYTSSESVRQILQTLRPHSISEGEICMIANICPETADEAFALIPSLKVNRFRTDGPIKNVLFELAKLKSVKEDINIDPP